MSHISCTRSVIFCKSMHRNYRVFSKQHAPSSITFPSIVSLLVHLYRTLGFQSLLLLHLLLLLPPLEHQRTDHHLQSYYNCKNQDGNDRTSNRHLYKCHITTTITLTIFIPVIRTATAIHATTGTTSTAITISKQQL